MMPTPAPDDCVTTALASLAATLPTARLWAAVAPQEPAGQGAGADHIATQFAQLQAAEGFIAPDTASATRLRRLGWRGPLALLPGVADARGLEACSRLGLWHGIGQAAQIDWLAAHKSQQPQPVLLLAGAHGMAAHHLRSRYARLAALPRWKMSPCGPRPAMARRPRHSWRPCSPWPKTGLACAASPCPCIYRPPCPGPACTAWPSRPSSTAGMWN